MPPVGFSHGRQGEILPLQPGVDLPRWASYPALMPESCPSAPAIHEGKSPVFRALCSQGDNHAVIHIMGSPRDSERRTWNTAGNRLACQVPYIKDTSTKIIDQMVPDAA